MPAHQYVGVSNPYVSYVNGTVVALDAGYAGAAATASASDACASSDAWRADATFSLLVAFVPGPNATVWQLGAYSLTCAGGSVALAQGGVQVALAQLPGSGAARALARCGAGGCRLDVAAMAA